MVKASSTLIDHLLVPWQQAVSTAEAEQSLAQLVTVHLAPVIKGIIHFKLRLGPPQAPEAEDIEQEALTEVLLELRKFKDRPAEHPIGDVRGLAATITYRTCYGWLRRQAPRRHALRNRLQYLLTRRLSTSY